MDQKPTWEFTCKYWENHPGAPPEEIEKAYQEHLKTQGPRGRLGGLGGTIISGDELGDGYEGVDITRETVCRRIPTTDRLLKCLLDKRIILVRSPPMAGKTTLAQLFEHTLLQSEETKKGLRRVFRISLLWMVRFGESWTFAEQFQYLMNGTSWADFVRKSDVETILIIDEIQKIYKPQGEKTEPLHGGKAFWDVFKNIQQYSRLRIVAFASYGYHGAYSVSEENGRPMEISPYHLDKANIWDFEDVRYTPCEFEDYFNRFCKHKLKTLGEADASLLSQYVQEATARHPGLVAFMMDKINERFVKHTESLTFVKIFNYIKSYGFHAAFKGIRAAPRLSNMTDEEKSLADAVLFRKGGIKLRRDAIPNDGRIVKTNILTDTNHASADGDSILDFPAPLLRAIYLQDRLGGQPRAEVEPKTFREFIVLVFGAMNPMTLRKSLGVGRDGRLLERVWQMEFYRAAIQVLPVDIHASVDVGAVFGSDGYLDFYVNDKRNWAIELLRDGDVSREHQQRFHEDGLYSSILQAAKEWAIIDIRQKKELPQRFERNFIYVRCSETFENVTLKFADRTEQLVTLSGTNQLLEIEISSLRVDH